MKITGSPIHKTTGRSTPPLRSRSGTVTPTSNNAAGIGLTPQMIQVKGVDNKLVQIIMDEIVEGGAKVRWSDIAGQDVRISLLLNTTEFLRIRYAMRNNYLFRLQNKRSKKWLFYQQYGLSYSLVCDHQLKVTKKIRTKISFDINSQSYL